jgi:hypothetical protein
MDYMERARQIQIRIWAGDNMPIRHLGITATRSWATRLCKEELGRAREEQLYKEKQME